MFTKAEQADAIARLRLFLKPGHTLHVVTKHVARSGMSRLVDVYLFTADPDGTIRTTWLTRLVAKALRWPTAWNGDVLRVNGCGMDMHFHTVYELSSVLFGDGNALSKSSL